MNEQGSCYKCLCELFNIFWCFRVENWYDNSVSINSIFIDKIDNRNSNIDNYRLLTPNSFIEFYRIWKKLIDFYRLLSNVIDYRYYRMTTPGHLAALNIYLISTFLLIYNHCGQAGLSINSIASTVAIIWYPFFYRLVLSLSMISGAPNENIVQNHSNIALLNVF